MSLNYGRTEWEALAIRWSTGRVSEEDQADLTKRMSRAESRQFKKKLEAVEQKKLHHGDAFVTGRQLAQYFGKYTEHTLMPLAANMDDLRGEVVSLRKVTDYLMMPFYERWWVRLRISLTVFNHWLNRHGIRFVQLNQSEAHDGDPGVLPDVGALGSEHNGARSDTGADGKGSSEHGLQGDVTEPRAGILVGQEPATGLVDVEVREKIEADAGRIIRAIR